MAEREYKYFKVSEVFGPAKLGKYHNPKDLAFDNNGYYYICASNKNNGVNQKMPRVNGKNLYLTPQKIVSWGKQCPKFTYHDEPCVTGQGMYYLDMTNYNEETALYLCAVLAGACKDKYNYSNCLIGSVMNDVTIPLPVTATGSIDWDFMTDYIRELEQERIRELEQERIRELDAYLKAAGLDSYELNAEDKRVLVLYREALEHKDEPEKCELQFGKFRLNELFDIETTWIYGKNKQYQTRYNQKESGSVAVVSGVTVNNGINYYTKDNLNSDEIFKDCLTISTRGEYSGTVFYHDEEFALANNILVMPMPGWSKEAKLYMMVVLKSLPFGGYNGYPTKDKLSESCIELPINDTGDINFDFIKKYIKAIEKISIANVVKYKNKVIAATKQVVKENSVSDAAAA